MGGTEFGSDHPLTQQNWKGGGEVPYKRQGNKVMHYKNGRWSVKQKCSSPSNAMAAIRLLHSKGYGDKEKK